MTMRKFPLLGAFALISALALAGCTATEEPNVVEPNLQENLEPIEWEADLIPFDSSVAKEQFKVYADGVAFPDNAPAYSILGPTNAVVFLAAPSSDQCSLSIDEFNVNDSRIQLFLSTTTSEVDCGSDKTVNPYVLTLGSTVDFSEFDAIEFCFEDVCSLGLRLEAPEPPVAEELVFED